MQLSDKTEKVIKIIFPEEKWKYVREIIIERLLSPYPNCGNTEQICLSSHDAIKSISGTLLTE